MIMTMMNYIYIDRNKRILQRMVPSSCAEDSLVRTYMDVFPTN